MLDPFQDIEEQDISRRVISMSFNRRLINQRELSQITMESCNVSPDPGGSVQGLLLSKASCLTHHNNDNIHHYDILNFSVSSSQAFSSEASMRFTRLTYATAEAFWCGSLLLTSVSAFRLCNICISLSDLLSEAYGIEIAVDRL
jgi:hypothetical protein